MTSDGAPAPCGNIARVDRLPASLTPYAVVTPDGLWHEWGQSFGVFFHQDEGEEYTCRACGGPDASEDGDAVTRVSPPDNPHRRK